MSIDKSMLVQQPSKIRETGKHPAGMQGGKSSNENSSVKEFCRGQLASSPGQCSLKDISLPGLGSTKDFNLHLGSNFWKFDTIASKGQVHQK